MPGGTRIHVAIPPGRPTLVYDGHCAFCRRWVERWRRMTADRVAYVPAQEVAQVYPEIDPDGFSASVWLIRPDGIALAGAAGALGVYAIAGEKRVLSWLYENFSPFAATAEAAYRFVATHRGLADRLAQALGIRLEERPSHIRVRSILLRGLGLVYLIAFASLAVQVDGLIGTRGILPAGEYLDRFHRALGADAYWQLPTLLWFDRSDGALHALAWGGVAVGLLLALGVMPRACSIVLWAGYLSLVVVGQDFLGFQWDALLLESGLLAILLAPGGLLLSRAEREPPWTVLWLFRWLVFRLMFLSGVVKLTSGDPAWRGWEAMRYHYETQPLPTWTSWYLHQMPAWFHQASVGFVLWAELLAPLLIFLPIRPRRIAFASFVLLQILIMATGNFGFFNILSALLCISLLDDRDLGRRTGQPDRRPDRPVVGLLLAGVAVIVLLVTTMEGLDRSGFAVVFPRPLERLRQNLEPLRSLNAYGLFAVMTTDRPEIVIEGSNDGETWLPYPFRWKPGDLRRRPRFATPHMPRLDWQLWFAALAGNCRNAPWFLQFERRLFEGSPAVLALLEENPFPEGPPRYIRARLYRYRFTTGKTTAWWAREEAGLYCPALSIAQ